MHSAHGLIFLCDPEQGGLLFLGLLLVLWAPLIVFSTGNPSYQVPGITSFSVNATLGSNYTAHGFARASTFPLFSAGERRVQAPWVTNASSIPDALRDEYAPNQVQLLCASEVSLAGPLSSSLAGNGTGSWPAGPGHC